MMRRHLRTSLNWWSTTRRILMDWLHGLRYQWRRSLEKWNTLWTQKTSRRVRVVVLKKVKLEGACIQQRCRVSWVCGTICQVYNRPRCTWVGCMRRGILHIDGIASTQLRANFSQRIELNNIATCFLKCSSWLTSVI